jgi:hypothetical protein
MNKCLLKANFEVRYLLTGSENDRNRAIRFGGVAEVGDDRAWRRPLLA